MSSYKVESEAVVNEILSILSNIEKKIDLLIENRDQLHKNKIMNATTPQAATRSKNAELGGVIRDLISRSKS